MERRTWPTIRHRRNKRGHTKWRTGNGYRRRAFRGLGALQTSIPRISELSKCQKNMANGDKSAVGTYRHRKNTAGVGEAGADAFLVQPGQYPFTGYNGQKNIIWDEFSGSSCDIKYLLQLTDRYPMTVRGLYTTYNFVGYKIWITSNLNPDEWYPNAHPEHKNALQRRLNEFGSVINKQ